MKRNGGFTLVEAAVAIGIVAVLSAIIIPLVLKNLEDARQARARNEINVIVAAIAAQMRDTGTRPRQQVVLPFGLDANPDGTGSNLWYSAGIRPTSLLPRGGIARFTYHPGNLFENLFCPPLPREGARLFGANLFNLPVHQDDLRYRGPYLSPEACRAADPWGNAYIIIGYNAAGLAAHSPIWVVSSGRDGRIASGNYNPGPGPGAAAVPQVWDTHLPGSEENIAVRVN